MADAIPRLVPRSKRTKAATNVEPPPPTPDLAPPPEPSALSFTHPTRRILSPTDQIAFLTSPSYTLILAWIFNLAESVRGMTMPMGGDTIRTPCVQQIHQVLDKIDGFRSQHPPHDTGSRFGNPAFRGLHQTLVDHSARLHTELLHVTDVGAVDELGVYLNHAFGSEERLDYGSGHELNFLMWLLCLYQLGRLKSQDLPALVLYTFPHYLEIMRQIQSTYYLEPAGSHGVWGLDDYHFLPFLFGASQLVNHPYITPRGIHNTAILDEEGDKYLYLNQVRWVDSVKTVKGLRWHSPMLDDISGARSWQKVEDGMKRMFVKEVLEKLPIMQHFYFGGFIPAVESMGRRSAADEQAQAERMKHVQEQGHEPDYWGDCCGIKVPSTVAAGEEMRKRMGTAGGLRPIPFD